VGEGTERAVYKQIFVSPMRVALAGENKYLSQIIPINTSISLNMKAKSLESLTFRLSH